MTAVLRWRRLLALAAAAALLSGCGTSSGMDQGPAPTPITSLASYRALSLPPDAVRHGTATRDAHRLLEAATLPPGAVATSASIAPAQTTGDPNVVDLHRTYAVATLPADPATAFLPERGTVEGSGSSNTGMTAVDFNDPSANLTLLYTMQKVTHGYLVRIDAQVTWLPAKPLGAYVAPGAARVAVAFGSAFFRVHHVLGTTVTSSTAIQRITSAVDAMQTLVGGTTCPLDTGATLTMDFWRPRAAHPFAIVVVDRTGCGGATIIHLDARGRPIATSWAAGLEVDAIARLAGFRSVPPAI